MQSSVLKYRLSLHCMFYHLRRRLFLLFLLRSCCQRQQTLNQKYLLSNKYELPCCHHLFQMIFGAHHLASQMHIVLHSYHCHLSADFHDQTQKKAQVQVYYLGFQLGLPFRKNQNHSLSLPPSTSISITDRLSPPPFLLSR